MISDLLETTEEQLTTKTCEYVISQLPTDIETFKNMQLYLSQHSTKYPKSLILLIYNLSISPFTKTFISDSIFLNNTINHLMKYINKEKKIDKYIFKIIAFYIVNYAHKKETIEVNSVLSLMHIGSITKNINVIKFDIILYLRILKEVSCLEKYDCLNNIRIVDNDTTIVKRLKVKILSHQDLTIEGVNHLLAYLNDCNTQFGWTLGKAIVRILAKCRCDHSISMLISNLTNLFAHESMWINTAHILSFLILKGIISLESRNEKYAFITNTIIPKMIYYTTIDSISERVRESGLFIMWSIIRKDGQVPYDGFILDLIGIALLDFSLSCRRAACTVLLELTQRKFVDKYSVITDLINFHTVKRYNDCVDKIGLIFDHIPESKGSLLVLANMKVFHRENSLHLAKFLKKYVDCFCQIIVPKSINNEILYGLSNLLNQFEENNICKNCAISENMKLLSEINLKDIYEDSIFYEFARTYIITMSILLGYGTKITNNIKFLLDKNIYPELAFKIAAEIDDDGFKNDLFNNLMRKNNDAYILSNSFNTDYKEKIKSKYLKILQGVDALKKAPVIQSLTFTLFSPKTLFDADFTDKKMSLYSEMAMTFGKFGYKEIESFVTNLNTDEALFFYVFCGLEEYSVYIKGDAGYFVRKASFDFMIKLKSIEMSCLYFFRYFVDKSRDLQRHVTIAVPLCNENSEFISFMNVYENKTQKMRTLNICLDEEIHYTACFKAFKTLNEKYKEQILLGFLSTFRNCDGYVYKFLSGMLFKEFSNFSHIIFKFLKYERRYKYLSVYFLNRYACSTKCLVEVKKIISQIDDNSNLKGNNQLKLLIDELYILKETLEIQE